MPHGFTGFTGHVAVSHSGEAAAVIPPSRDAIYIYHLSGDSATPVGTFEPDQPSSRGEQSGVGTARNRGTEQQALLLSEWLADDCSLVVALRDGSVFSIRR